MIRTACAFVALGLAAACNPNAETNNPAVATDESVAERQAAAPAAGATSFTEAQARQRLEEKGYTSATALTQDPSGAWRAQATKDGQPVTVVVDYQGNVTPAPQGNTP